MNPRRVSIFVRFLAMLQFAMVMPIHANEWDATWAGDTSTIPSLPATYTGGPPYNAAHCWVGDSRGGVTHFSGNGEILKRIPGNSPFNSPSVGGGPLRNLADGGALFYGGGFISRTDAENRLIWSFNVYSVMTSTVSGDTRFITTQADGAVWLVDNRAQHVHKIAPDGQLAFSLSAADLDMTTVQSVGVAASRDYALVVGTRGSENANVASAAITRDGTIRWHWVGPAAPPLDRQNYLAALVIDDAHAVTIAAGDQVTSTYARHDATGVTTVSTSLLPELGFNDIVATQATSDGVLLTTSFVLPNNLFAQFTLTLINRDGQVRNATELDEGEYLQFSHDRLMEVADGSIWAISPDHRQSPAANNLLRLSAGGITRIPLAGLQGTPVLLAIAPTGSSAIVAHGNGHSRVDLGGQITSLGTMSTDESALMVRAMGTTDAEGNAYIVQRRSRSEPSSAGSTISKIARDGSRVWSAPVVEHVRFPTTNLQFISSQIAANATRVCFYIEAANYLYCHSATTGAFQTRIELPAPGGFSALDLNANNQIILRRRLSGAEPELVLSADNQPISTASPALFAPRLSNTWSQYLDFGDSTSTSISVITRIWGDLIGIPSPPTITWQLGNSYVPAVMPDGAPAIMLLAEGSALLLGYEGSAQGPLVLRKLNADGSLGFRRVFDGPPQQRVNLQQVDDRILVSTVVDPSSARPGESRLFGLSLLDGSISWQHSVTSPFPYYGAPGFSSELVIQADGLHAVWWTSDTVDVNARNIRISDGIEVARNDMPCTLAPCLIDRIRTDAFGTTLLPQASRRERVLFVASARADQEMLEGAWYQTATSGQGILFDYLPESRVWFGTWHTTGLTGANSRAALRWFTLQGEASADGTEATLGIYLASGGKFDRGPSVPSLRIGDATLTFDSCSSADLQYRITSGEFNGQNGSIPLRLLTPHSGSCAAIGQPVTGVTASTRNGISSSYSGSWYNPETSGQGLEAAVRPDLGNGTIVAGWFTFDPEAASDDPQAQHWFTLQGDLSTAANGVVTLPIFRTIGGRFDQIGTRNTSRVGEATWSFGDCAHSQLSYHFDDSDIAGSFAGRIGIMTLQRLGACAVN